MGSGKALPAKQTSIGALDGTVRARAAERWASVSVAASAPRAGAAAVLGVRRERGLHGRTVGRLGALACRTRRAGGREAGVGLIVVLFPPPTTPWGWIYLLSVVRLGAGVTVTWHCPHLSCFAVSELGQLEDPPAASAPGLRYHCRATDLDVRSLPLARHPEQHPEQHSPTCTCTRARTYIAFLPGERLSLGSGCPSSRYLRAALLPGQPVPGGGLSAPPGTACRPGHRATSIARATPASVPEKLDQLERTQALRLCLRMKSN